MKRLVLAITMLIPILCSAQSLGKERVNRIKESVARVLIENVPSGTAFFLTSDGLLASCWHVIEPAMIRDSITNEILSVRQISIELSTGKRIKVGIPIKLIQQLYLDAISYDFVLLIPDLPLPRTFPFLKIGNFDNINEGDYIVSNGYPLGIKQNFISTGILSSKWVDTVKINSITQNISTQKRDVAWLDLTMNKGNSGGPVIKVGQNVQQDEVIGIATFILNPYANDATQLANYLSNTPGFDMIMNGISNNKINALYANAIANNSIGVSGCVSINHLVDALKKIK